MIVSSLTSLLRKYPSLRQQPLLRQLRFEGIVKRLPKLGFSRFANVQIGPLRLQFDITDDFQRMMALGNYEEFTQQLIQKTLRPGDTYVDIGTQLGFTAAQAAEMVGPTGRLVLFEPDPVALERLEGHLASANPTTMPKVDLVKMAASDRDGVLRFHVSDILGHSRIIAEGETVNTGRVIEVPTKAADDVLESLGIESIRFLKIDAEGHEISVLRGLQRTLSKIAPEVILVEKNHYLFADPIQETHLLYSLIAINDYVGIHEGTSSWINEESLLSVDFPLENFIMVKDQEILSHFCNTPHQINNLFAKPYAQVALVEWHREKQGLSLIKLVKSGRLQEGIEEGEKLIVRFPDWHWFRGHLAFWQHVSGNKQKALTHYRYLNENGPQNKEIEKIISELSI